MRPRVKDVGRQLAWTWLFPVTRTYRRRETCEHRHHHLHETVLQKPVSDAKVRAGLTQRIPCPIFGPSFAPYWLEDGSGIRTLQELLGRRRLKARMIYTDVLNKGPLAVRSPRDRL